MNKITIAALTLLVVGAAMPAVAQKHMTQPMQMQQHSGMNKMMEVAFMGLTPNEKKIAMHHWEHMSQAEKDVMMKRMSLCMADPHKDMMKHMHDMSMDMKMQHMMSGLSKGDQHTMRHMMSTMSPEEHKVGEKMMMNCCMYGMKNAGHMHHMG